MILADKTKGENASLQLLTAKFIEEESHLRAGGGEAGHARQQKLGRLTVRERLEILLDNPKEAFELSIWAGYGMYKEWGALPAAGVITTIGSVAGRNCMIIANDATVKAGAMFPQSVKKVLRAQKIAFECRLPVLYLVDSSGVFLPLQDEIFPDEDDFGRIFRNNAIFSAAGIPQYAAIMGNCIAGGGYLPVLCDKLLMTEGSGLYLAGPSLVKAAIGQIVDTEELGGARMHAEISGTVDFLEKNDQECLLRLRQLVGLLPKDKFQMPQKKEWNCKEPVDKVYELVGGDSKKTYDMHDLLDCIIDLGSFQEYKALYGKTILTGYAKIDGMPVGIVANQRIHATTGRGEVKLGGVIYAESADKAARFIMDCNQMKIPLLFLQDVFGFMVGKEAEQSGIIRSGAKMVNAISNSVVPKITIIVGNSFGAGNYAMCGKAYDPNFILAWPNAKYAVMGADQAADTLFTLQEKSATRLGNTDDSEKMRKAIKARYDSQMDIRYGAARGWVDGIIPPHKTRDTLIHLLTLLKNAPMPTRTFRTGVCQE
jgi:acetyl-CoA carboxylase carboxyltransferase component